MALTRHWSGTRASAAGCLAAGMLLAPAPLAAQASLAVATFAVPASDLTAPAPAPAAAQGQPPQGPQRPSFLDMRYDEDWSVLKNPALRGDLFDSMKYIELGERSYLSLGGEVRHRVDYWRDANFGYVPARNMDSVMQRYQFHADWHIGDHVRAFGQFASALQSGKRGGPWPTDENPAEVHQAFVEFRGGSPSQSTRWALRLGRQEMAFGQSHFISTSDFYNTRRSFDGVRVQATRGVLEFNAFLTRPVEIKFGAFDDGSDQNQLFGAASIFMPNPFTRRGRAAVFYINLATDRWQWERGPGRDERHMLGLRLIGQENRWDYVYEVLLQRGMFNQVTPIRAWAVTTDTGYAVAYMPRYTRFGVRFNITSGDAGHGSLGTFNPMFPDNAYSGKIGLVGPSNSIDFTPNLTIALTRRVFFIPDVAFFWRQKTSDGIYGVVSPYLVTPGGFSKSRFVGTQVSLPMQVAITPHLTYTVALSNLMGGGFVHDIRGRTTTFLTNFLTYKF